jgi:hypothetical protein
MAQFADARGQRGNHATPYPALTNPQWERLRDSQDTFSGVLAWWPNNFGLGSPSNLRLVRGLFVSGTSSACSAYPPFVAGSSPPPTIIAAAASPSP